MPCELVASILGSLDDFQSLTAALLTCRHIYNSFNQIHGIDIAILRQQITPALLPYAVAVIRHLVSVFTTPAKSKAKQCAT